MIRIGALFFLALAGASASAATLPLKPGVYVLADTPCHDPAFAAVFTYDGRHFSYPHASKCNSRILSRSGPTYKVRETFTARGDGAPATPETTMATYTITSATQILIDDRNRRTNFRYRYRWCAAR